MPTIFIRTTFLICHIVIQILWAVTSRGRNIQSFLKTWTHIQSVPIVLFELIGFIQVLLLPYLAFPITSQRVPHIELLGLFISIFGTILASWAKIIMGTSWGRPAQHNRKIQSRLITTGPFVFTRNPIYVGLVLLFLGQQIAYQSYGILLVILFAVAINQAVSIEEKLLVKHFGTKYVEYMKHVPRFL